MGSILYICHTIKSTDVLEKTSNQYNILKQFLTCKKTVEKYAVTVEVNVSQGTVADVKITRQMIERIDSTTH